MFLDKYINEHGVSSDYPVFEDIYKDIMINTKDLFLAQFKDGEFNAVDIAVKYLAIENYYGLNNYGFNLYNKLQYYRTGKNWSERFKNLIKSFEKGYDNNSFIDADLNYSIHDGAHRVALALFHNVDELKVRLFNTNLYRREYKFDFLLPYFNADELSIIRNKLNELLSKCREPYYTILWPPAYNLFDEIKDSIPKIESGVEVLNNRIIKLDSNLLKKFIYDIYSTDDIKKYKLDLKNGYMINSINNSSLNSPYPISIMKTRIDIPDFRVKPLNGNPQSKVTMRIKTNIRDTYQRYINDYHYDIMMHMTDNNKQNKEVEKIIKKVVR